MKRDMLTACQARRTPRTAIDSRSAHRIKELPVRFAVAVEDCVPTLVITEISLAADKSVRVTIYIRASFASQTCIHYFH